VADLLAPWVGYRSEKRGPRLLLLVGFGLESIRAAMLALSANHGILAIAQLLDGITGAIIGVLTVLVISDLTAGTGRFNLARGTTGALVSVAGSTSTIATGFLVQSLGCFSTFWIIAVVACAATALIWRFLSDTGPKSCEGDPLRCSKKSIVQNASNPRGRGA
jgi:MFS family permease